MTFAEVYEAFRKGVVAEPRVRSLPDRVIPTADNKLIHVGRHPAGVDGWIPLLAVKPVPKVDGEVPTLLSLGLGDLDDRLILDSGQQLFGWLAENPEGEAVLTTGCDPEDARRWEQQSGDDALNERLKHSCATWNRQPALLMLNPSAILDFDSDGSEGEAQSVEVVIRIEAVDPEAKRQLPAIPVRIGFDVAPYRCGLDDISIELTSGRGTEFPYPVLAQNSRYECVGNVRIALQTQRKFVTQFDVYLNLRASTDIGDHVALQVIRDEVLESLPGGIPLEQEVIREWLSLSQPEITMPVYALFGHSEKALPEPDNATGLTLSVWLSLTDHQVGLGSETHGLSESQQTERHIRDTLRLYVVPQSGPLVLSLRAHNSELDRHGKDMSFSLGEKESAVSTVVCEPRSLRAMRKAVAAYRTLLELEVSLEGDLGLLKPSADASGPVRDGTELQSSAGIGADSGIELEWTLELKPIEGGCSPTQNVFVLQNSEERFGARHTGRLGYGSRATLLQLNMDVQVNAYGSKIDQPVPVGTVHCRLVGRRSDGSEFVRLVLEQEVGLLPPMADRHLAIDLGTSAIAAAISALDQKPHSVNLGEALEFFDEEHEELGSFFISSVVGLGLDQAWRGIKTAGPSTWGRVLDPSPSLVPEQLATSLGRTYSVAVPLAPSNQFGMQEGIVLAAPKMLLMEPDGIVDVSESQTARLWSTDRDSEYTRKVKIEHLVSDIFDELADYHLPWAGVGDKIYEARLVLTHPSRYSVVHKKRLQFAARKICRRIGADPTDVALLAESDAAAAYFLEKVDVSPYPEGLKAVAYDLGAGTLDVSLVEAPMENVSTGKGNLGRSIVRQRVGASVGGDTVDLVIYFIVNALLEKMTERIVGLEYKNPLLMPRRELLESSDPRQLLKAKHNVAMAIRAAKADLSKRCRRATAEFGDGRFGWAEGESLSVKVGEKGNEDWPVWLQVDWLDDSLSGFDPDYASLRLVDKDIVLVLSKSALMRPAMVDLMKFMTDTVMAKLFSEPLKGFEGDQINLLLVSGRAALWPMVYDGLAEALKEHCPNAEFAFMQPPDAEEMKNAVVLGALHLAHDPDRAELAPTYDRIGLLFHQPGETSAGFIADWREIKQDVTELDALRDQVKVMLAPPGVTLEELQQDPWAISLLLATGESYSAREISRTEGPIRILRRYDKEHQQFTLKLGNLECDVGGGKPLRMPALHFSNYDVTAKDAPPKFPGSVEPECAY